MKNKLKLFLTATVMAGALLSFSTTNQNSLNLNETVVDFTNETQQVNLRKTAIGDAESVGVSRTFAQYGEFEGRTFLRFATAVSGPISSITYTRAVEGYEEVNNDVTIVYRGLTSGEDVVYYNHETEELTTDEAYAGNYYWACYLIEINQEEAKSYEFTVFATVVGENDETVVSAAKTASLNSLLPAPELKEYSIDGQIIQDTYVSSNSSSSKDKTYGKEASIGTNKDKTRPIFKYSFANILNSEDYQSSKETAKVEFTFAFAKGADVLVDTVKCSAYSFAPGEGVSDVDINTLTWNLVGTGKDMEAFNRGTANFMFRDKVFSDCADIITLTETHITYTFAYSTIESAINTLEGSSFGIGIFGFDFNIAGIGFASMESDSYDAPSVRYIYQK